MLLSRIFWKKCVRVNSCNFHIVYSIAVISLLQSQGQFVEDVQKFRGIETKYQKVISRYIVSFLCKNLSVEMLLVPLPIFLEIIQCSNSKMSIFKKQIWGNLQNVNFAKIEISTSQIKPNLQKEDFFPRKSQNSTSK